MKPKLDEARVKLICAKTGTPEKAEGQRIALTHDACLQYEDPERNKCYKALGIYSDLDDTEGWFFHPKVVGTLAICSSARRLFKP
eukprot:scaffold31076_cov33-Prasinocladus_malaysianus.AAC.1